MKSRTTLLPFETRLLRSGDPAAVQEAAGYLRQGQPVVFPTDTVYGIGVNPFDGQAIERLYEIKQRPPEKGIPILLADKADLEKVAASVPVVAQHLIDKHWPGPLTLIVPRHPELPAILSPNGNIAVRIPDHPVARELIRAAGGAIATTSANLSGQQPATSGLEALAAFNGTVTVVIDDGPSPGSVSSTIVDCTIDFPTVLRVGPLSAIELGLEPMHR
ncbi:MAG: L-threonylcarbamoyladenylate synthase [Chloroflexota bacterium]